MLADSRTDKVIGRIILLISSINTIKFKSTNGVPLGTVCAIIFLVLFTHPNIIMPDHNSRLDVNDIVRWAVGVNTKGSREKKFITPMFKKIIMRIATIPFL
jgi:hypothetical protein